MDDSDGNTNTAQYCNTYDTNKKRYYIEGIARTFCVGYAFCCLF